MNGALQIFQARQVKVGFGQLGKYTWMSDMPLFQGGAIRAGGKSQLLYMLSEHKAGWVPILVI